MSAAQHTPGPWQWDNYCLRPARPDPDTSAVQTIIEADTIGWGYLLSDPLKTRAESDANLALIAAEAVLAKGKWLKGTTDPESVALYKLRDAIARAAAAIDTLADHAKGA